MAIGAARTVSNMNNSAALKNLWQKYLFWYRHSLWVNWLWLPLVTSALMAPFFVQTQYADLYDVIRRSSTFTVEGKINPIGVKASRRVLIITPSAKYNAYCSLLWESGNLCIPQGYWRTGKAYKIEIANYKGFNIILSAKDDDKEFIKKSERIKSIKDNSDYSSKLGYWHYLKFGYFSLLFLCAFRYLIYIRPRRKIDRRFKNDQ